MRPLTYLACPYSHTDREVRLERFHAVNAAAARLMHKGKVVFSPISMTHPIAEDKDLPLDWEFWKEFDVGFLLCSKELYVLCMPGWATSKGVNAEIGIARDEGIPVYFLERGE